MRDFESVRDVKVSRQNVSFVGIVPDAWFIDATNKEWECSLSFADIKFFTVALRNGYSYVSWNGDSGLLWVFRTPSDAMSFVNGALSLKALLRSPEQELSDFAKFSNRAQRWLDATPKPEMSDEARTYRALAEDAISRKDFLGALDAYCEALERHPMWPEGHYNAALLAAETEDFGLAAKHMRRYLVLAPDAPDAAAAKDKFLLWQHKAMAAEPANTGGAVGGIMPRRKS